MVVGEGRCWMEVRGWKWEKELLGESGRKGGGCEGAMDAGKNRDQSRCVGGYSMSIGRGTFSRLNANRIPNPPLSQKHASNQVVAVFSALLRRP